MDEFKNGDGLDNFDKIAWGLFAKTGNIGHYLLYSKVKKKTDDKKPVSKGNIDKYLEW